MSAAPTLLDLVRDAGCRLEESGAWPYLGGWITDDDNRKILADALSATKEVRWFEGLLVYLTRKIPGILPVSSVSPQILPQTSSRTQGNSRVARMEHQTPSGFPGNFRKRKVLGTLWFPFLVSGNMDTGE